MAAGLYPPLNRLKSLGPEIWLVDGPAIRFYGMPFPTRMVVVRLEGGLWLHSPIAPDAGLFEQLADLGRVRWLVAPNNIHYAHLPAWAERFPEAQVHAAPGVAERAARHGLAFPPHELLGDAPPPDWAGAIDQRLVPGHPFLNEVVFFHRPSRTLILTDLIENFEASRLRWPMRLAACLAGNLDPDGKTPVDMRLSWRDKAAARAVMDEVIGWAPEQVVMAHGRIYRENAVAELTRAFRWLG
ncbi:MAG: DUF4336 domain-containing protein [Paracoccaceae bacterium]